MTEQPTPLDVAMSKRRKELDMRWKDVAEQAGVSEETVRIVRKGMRDTAIRTTDTEARIERALRWAKGSIRAIRQGGEPTPVEEIWAPRVNGNRKNYPDFVMDDQGYKAIWNISDELLSPRERRYAILQIELLRWLGR